jgi:hypothetical protein
VFCAILTATIVKAVTSGLSKAANVMVLPPVGAVEAFAVARKGNPLEHPSQGNGGF